MKEVTCQEGNKDGVRILPNEHLQLRREECLYGEDVGKKQENFDGKAMRKLLSQGKTCEILGERKQMSGPDRETSTAKERKDFPETKPPK